MTNKKPRPENRKREPRPAFERRMPPMYSNFGGQPRGPYMGNDGPPQGGRGGYYSAPSSSHYDNRRPPMQMDQPPHARYDPYRRPDFYDPYMQPRGGAMPPRQPNFYQQSNKFQNSGAPPRSSQPAPPRYSNPYHRK